MPDYTDEEYDALDEHYTKNPPKLSGNGKSGFVADWLRIIFHGFLRE